MPNLKQITAFREKYNRPHGLSGFDVERWDSFTGAKGESYEDFFALRRKCHVVMMFIDMVDFSTRFQHLEVDSIVKILDKFYDSVIPVIYHYGGEVEKTIGDGIICVFGLPFLSGDLTKLLLRSHSCAKDIIKQCDEMHLNVKIAIHDGPVAYYKSQTKEFKEYTMLGNSLTELFRLETVSHRNSINYYSQSSYDYLISGKSQPIKKGYEGNFEWIILQKRKIDLVGVSYTHVGSIKYNWNKY